MTHKNNVFPHRKGDAMKRHIIYAIILFSALLLLQALGVAGTVEPAPPAPDQARVQSLFGCLPLYFIENQGQIDSEDVAFYVKGWDKTLYFTPDGVTFSLTGNEFKTHLLKTGSNEPNEDGRNRMLGVQLQGPGAVERRNWRLRSLQRRHVNLARQIRSELLPVNPRTLKRN